ncbi:MAG: hypothetical protein U1E89_11485 [Burkholderiaceae bacterium]
MTGIRRVFITQPIDQGWIIERLMSDVATELKTRGVAARIGTGEEYQGEEVIFNARFLTPKADPRAIVNSLFITHIDDGLKERELRAVFPKFNSFVCLSPHDAEFVAALKGDWNGIVGIELPARSSAVRPVRLAMFSARYEDGRKNEEWIVEYFRQRPQAFRTAFVFCFMGWGWEQFCSELAELDVNFEVYRYSRSTPGEYDLYRAVLPTMNALIYLGFDGGAMSVYDAVNAGLDVLATDLSYHKGLGDSVTLFDDRAGFFRELDRLQHRHAARLNVIERRSVTAYVDRLLSHWNEVANVGASVAPCNEVGAPDAQALEAGRRRYKKLSLTRIRSAIIRSLQAFQFK